MYFLGNSFLSLLLSLITPSQPQPNDLKLIVAQLGTDLSHSHLAAQHTIALSYNNN